MTFGHVWCQYNRWFDRDQLCSYHFIPIRSHDRQGVVPTRPRFYRAVRVILLIRALLVLAVFAQPVVPIGRTDAGLLTAGRPRPLAAYGFEQISRDMTPDSSGNNHPATLVNAVLTTGRFGKAWC